MIWLHFKLEGRYSCILAPEGFVFLQAIARSCDYVRVSRSESLDSARRLEAPPMQEDKISGFGGGAESDDEKAVMERKSLASVAATD